MLSLLSQMQFVQRVSIGLLGTDKGLLIQQRGHRSIATGKWEFPGGKLHSGECPLDALVRELREEIGVTVVAAELWHSKEADSVRPLLLMFWKVLQYQGKIRSCEGLPMRWVMPEQMRPEEMLPANGSIIRKLVVEGLPVQSIQLDNA